MPVWKPAANVDLILNVTYDNGARITYNATTNKAGEYNLQIPVQEFPTTFTYTVTVMPVDNVTFTHYKRVLKEMKVLYDGANDPVTFTYYDYVPTTLKGWFQSLEDNYTTRASFAVASTIYTKDFKALVFETNDTETTYTSGAWTPYGQWLSELLEELKAENASK